MTTKLICPQFCTRRFDCDTYHEPEPRCPDAIEYRVQPPTVLEAFMLPPWWKWTKFHKRLLVVALIVAVIAGLVYSHYDVFVEREQIPQTSIVLMEGGK